MKTYAALLRGINSGKNPIVKMEVLRKIFEHLGFRNVKTVLASGNVLFETNDTDERFLEEKIEKALPTAIGFETAVIVRTIDDLRKLVRLDPFKNVEVNSQNKPYLTFMKVKLETKLEFPVKGRGYTILGADDRVVYSTVDLSSAMTPDLMRVLDQQFGKNVTTRSWKTVEKILKAVK